MESPPGQISIAEMIDAIDEKVVSEIRGWPACIEGEDVLARGLRLRLNRLVRHTLGQVSLSDVNRPRSLPGERGIMPLVE